MKVLLTGGNGFAGHHVAESILKNTDWDIDIMDRLSYASNGYSRLKEVDCYDDSRIRHFSHDFVLPIVDYLYDELKDVDYIIHMGAETHVDNSITNPEPFVRTNVMGTMNLLEFARQAPNLKKFFYMGTDEVFGPADAELVPNGFKEWDRYNSTNPYSASKAGGEELCLAWSNTYGVPVIIGHTMNIFGERQHHEKFIPKVVRAVLNGETVVIHADKSLTVSGSRFWIHARNVAQAIQFLLENGENRDKYNIVGEREVSNLDMAKFIANVLGKELKYDMVDFHSSRPGHDLRYGLDGAKLKAMGFEYPRSFEESLTKTIEWTLENPKWIAMQDTTYVSNTAR
ncbi:MAG: NAD-dependent epimerase/dehydratase family protein [Pyrinomonadaceae bacterium]